MKFTKPRIIGRLNSPKAGFWRARICPERISGIHSNNLITLLVTIVSLEGTKTIGWTCRESKFTYHGVHLPVGTKLVLVRLLQNFGPDVLDVQLKWLGSGVRGKLTLAFAKIVKHIFPKLKNQQNTVIEAIEALPVSISSNCSDLGANLDSLSILVPSRDHPELLEALYQSCFKRLIAAGGEVIIIDHASVLPITQSALARLAHAGCVVARVEGPFNFSRLINHAASIATRSRYLILNDDVMPLRDESFIKVASFNSGKYQAIFAPELVYPTSSEANTRVQHAGVFLGMGGLSGHWLRNSLLSSREAVAWRAAPRKVDALTGAILLVDAAFFHKLRGFDTKYSVECGDIDFCLRAAKLGWQNIMVPQFEWSHPESVSRGQADDAQYASVIQRDRRRFWLQWRDTISHACHLPDGIDPDSETPKMLLD